MIWICHCNKILAFSGCEQREYLQQQPIGGGCVGGSNCSSLNRRHHPIGSDQVGRNSSNATTQMTSSRRVVATHIHHHGTLNNRGCPNSAEPSLMRRCVAQELVHKIRRQSRGEGAAKRWSYLIFSKNDCEGERWGHCECDDVVFERPLKWNSPLYRRQSLDIVFLNKNVIFLKKARLYLLQRVERKLFILHCIYSLQSKLILKCIRAFLDNIFDKF